jgi:hypothetical protein
MGLHSVKAPVAFIVLYALLLFVAAIPLFTVHHPPLQDYPNHLARMYILINPDNPLLQRHWTIGWGLLPNLAMDIVVPILAKFLSLELAGKFFVLLIIVVLTSGTVALHFAVYRRISFLTLLSFLFVPNLALQKGFLNFLFGIGWALWAVAFWIVVRKRHVLLRWLTGLISSIFLFPLHLYALATYALVVIAYEIGISRISTIAVARQVIQRLLVFSTSLLPIAIAFLLLSPTSSGQSSPLVFGSFIERANIAPYLFPPTAHWRLDWVASFTLYAICILSLASGVVRIARPLYFSLAVLLACYLVLPSILFSSANANWRMLVPLVFIFLASLSWQDAEAYACKIFWSGRFLIVFLVTLRFSMVTFLWTDADKSYESMASLLDQVPRGSRLFTAIRNIKYTDATIRRPLLHLSAYGVINRDLFVPSLFAISTQQPIRYSAAYDKLLAQGANKVFHWAGEEFNCSMITSNFDYFILIDGDQSAAGVPCGLPIISREGDMILLAIPH